MLVDCHFILIIASYEYLILTQNYVTLAHYYIIVSFAIFHFCTPDPGNAVEALNASSGTSNCSDVRVFEVAVMGLSKCRPVLLKHSCVIGRIKGKQVRISQRPRELRPQLSHRPVPSKVAVNKSLHKVECLVD